MLVPSATLVVLVLGAIAVDLSQLFLAKRELLDAAASMANDAAGAGLDPASLRDGGPPRLDPDRARDTAYISMLSQQIKGLDPTGIDVTVDPVAGTVTVELAAVVERTFGRIVPGTHPVRITATATATGHRR